MPLALRPLALCGLVLVAAGCGDRAAGRRPTVQVFAAASLRELVAELAASFERREPAVVELNLAGSNTLAQQILAAPGADVFLSADRHWVEVLERRGRTVAGSRRPLLSNRLVLIERAGAGTGITRPEQLAAGGYRHLALADPEGVPAGRYARAALAAIEVDGSSVWEAVAGRVVPTLDVRAALALVESDDEVLGLVYLTDARSSPRVRILVEFAAAGAAAVTYYGVLLSGARAPALGRRFLDFLATPEAGAIAERYGFGTAGETALEPAGAVP